MKKLKTALILCVLLLSVACGSKVNKKIAELEAKPAATTVEGAKALYDEISELIAWVQNPESSEKATPEELERAKALQTKRWDELVALGGGKLVDGVRKILDAVGLKDLDLSDVKKKAGEAKDWILGVDDPRMKKFGCPEGVDVTQEGASKKCK